MRRKAIAMTFLALAAGSGHLGATDVSDEAVLRDIIMKQWPATAEAGDVTRYLTFLSDDMPYMMPGQPVLRDKQAVGRFLAPAFESAKFEISVDAPEELRVLGEWAFVRYQVLLLGRPNAGEAFRIQRKCLDIWRKRKG